LYENSFYVISFSILYSFVILSGAYKIDSFIIEIINKTTKPNHSHDIWCNNVYIIIDLLQSNSSENWFRKYPI